jgi:hypothetical protein
LKDSYKYIIKPYTGKASGSDGYRSVKTHAECVVEVLPSSPVDLEYTQVNALMLASEDTV